MIYNRLPQQVLVFLIILFSAFLSSCKNNDTQLVVDPVADGELKSTFPRIGFSEEKKEKLESKKNSDQWVDLITRMSNQADGGSEQYGFGAYHFAVAYAVTGEQKYAQTAREMILRVIHEPGYCNLTSTYLRAPGCTGQVAFAADILFSELSDEDKEEIFDYLETAASGIVNLEGWSGWGWQDGNPAFKELNNFYPGHVQTILNYALLAYNHRELARGYYKMIVEEELPRAFDMIREELAGGHGAEGTWYDDKMFGHYAEVVLMLREATQGKVDFGKEYADVFADYATWRLYSVMNRREENGEPQLYDTPTGDQPAVDEAKIIDLARLRLWLFSDVLKDTDRSEVAAYIRYFDENIDFEVKGYQREYQLHYLLHFTDEAGTADFTQVLPAYWYSAGKGVAQYRTGWDENAMAVTIHFSPSQGQRNSHWHFGEGAFYIWYKGWQADHLNRVEGNGIRQFTGLMNTLLVNSNDGTQGRGDARVLAFKGGPDFMMVKGDASEMYSESLGKFERTLIVSGHMISIYDHAEKLNAEDEINFIVNNQSGFAIEGNRYTAQNLEGQLVIETMFPTGMAGNITSEASQRTMGIQVNLNSSGSTLNMLHALQVGDKGSVPAVVSEVQDGWFYGTFFKGADASYVHMINVSNQGATGLSYELDATHSIKHVIAGLNEGDYRVLQNGQTLTNAKVGEDGVLSFSSPAGGIFNIVE